MRNIPIAALIACAMTSAAHAAEPRPWLCRDKPVFSSGHAMNYQLTTRAGWELFLMQFSPGAGHDGFDIVKTVGSTSAGQLSAGQYFAVALHRSGGNWICPTEVNEQHGGGAISSLCFASHEGACTAKLVVTPDTSSPSAP